jgi:hypothetical protein
MLPNTEPWSHHEKLSKKLNKGMKPEANGGIGYKIVSARLGSGAARFAARYQHIHCVKGKCWYLVFFDWLHFTSFTAMDSLAMT